MLGWLASFITGPILGRLADAYKAKLSAATDRDKLSVDLATEQMKAEIEARKIAGAQVIAEQGRWYTAMIRPLFALPFVIYAWKVVVWDKVLGWGVTDPLSGAIGEWSGYIIIAYFGGRSVEKVAQIIGRRK